MSKIVATRLMISSSDISTDIPTLGRRVLVPLETTPNQASPSNMPTNQ
jgi:hypothetical protein